MKKKRETIIKLSGSPLSFNYNLKIYELRHVRIVDKQYLKFIFWLSL